MPDVLVVDDQVAMRELLRLALDLMGCDVAEAADGAVALAHLRATPRRTIVVLDSLLPDMDSIALLEVIASDPRLAFDHAYLLMVDKRHLLPEYAHTVLAALGVPLLFKLFDLDMLFEAVAYLGRHWHTTGIRSADSTSGKRGLRAATPQSHRRLQRHQAARLRSRCRRRGQESARRAPRRRARRRP
jgi:CheY-like chemotaxis protein